MKNLLIALLCTITSILKAQGLEVYDLKTEQLTNPIGLDMTHPRFSWKLKSDKQATMQSTCEITVATAADFNAKSIVWNIKKTTDQSLYHAYAGKPLISNTRYYWKISVSDNHGRQVMSTTPAYWHTGLLNNEWVAKWITTTDTKNSVDDRYQSPLFRKEFKLPKTIKTATLFITSKGLYQAYINGHRVGQDYFTPGWTSYTNRTQYQAYDVTALLQKGQNAIGAVLAKGWYKGEIGWIKNAAIYGKELGIIAQLMITTSDNKNTVISTDSSWTYSHGDILDSEIYHGEIVDHRLSKPGWSSPGFTGSTTPVSILPGGTNHLIGTYNQPVRKKEIIKPIKLIITPESDTVLDFGQNMVGWVKIQAYGKQGDAITIHHAEVLDKKGNFYVTNLRRAKQENVYILQGDKPETFEPSFTFQGFRYIRLKGYPGPIDLRNFEAVALYSDMDRTGSFECSHPLINQLQQNIQWGQRGNFVDVPTDCPQRDERLGWTGDAQAFARTAAYNFDVQNFFAKWLLDLAADQNKDGGVPFVIPNALNPKAASSAGWADAATIIPWNMYWIYGDTSFLQRQYPSMKKWVQYMVDSSTHHLWNRGFHFGDWLFFSMDDDRDGRSAVTDKYLIAQCFFANSVQLMVQTARILNNNSDEQYYSKLLEDVKKAFRKEYVTGTGRLISSTQTAYVLALEFDMLEPAHRPYVAKLLADNILSYNYHLTTGFLGTPYICHVLSKHGYADIAYKLLFQDTYPSWLYPVKMGATTIWERWDGIKPDSTFQTPSMNSFNHYAYGAIGDWMYRSVAGIEVLEAGYKKSRIAPLVTDSLTFASSGTSTPYGPIKSSWTKNEKSLDFTVEIPVNTTSEIILPVSDVSRLTVDGVAWSQSPLTQKGVKSNSDVKIALGSGKYVFALKK